MDYTKCDGNPWGVSNALVVADIDKKRIFNVVKKPFAERRRIE